MKIKHSKTHVTISDGLDVVDFGIVFDRHMVQILSNQLYENKVEAIVRELSTNALDSHVEADNANKQFDVHMPIWDKMEFSIRDYGVGMSPDKIKNVYTMYGVSDRSDSNDFTGCMGLGSKTPFCYNTKTFTVDSWYNGIHYQYACFLDEDGMPKLAKMSEIKSNDPLGVKITLPVSTYDDYEFVDAIQKIYQFFTIKPNFLGKTINIASPEYSLEDGCWKYDDTDNDMKIIMGNVAYSVSKSVFNDLTSSQKAVLNNGFHVYVDIGEVSPTASREGLDYTNRTKTKIRQYINEIIKAFNIKAQDEIASCKNLWEARIKFSKYSNTDLRNIFDPTLIKYNNKELFDKDTERIDFKQLVKDNKIELNAFSYNSYCEPIKQKINTVIPKNNYKFYVNDLKIGGFIRSIAESKRHKQNILLITFKTKNVKIEFCELLGLDDTYFTNISTIPSPTTRSRASRTKITNVVKYNPECYSSHKFPYWINKKIDIKTGGIYVEFNRFDVKINGNKIHPKSFNSYLKKLANLNIVIPSIYGIKTANISKFDQHPKWQDFLDWAIQQVVNKSNNIDFMTSIQCKKLLNTVVCKAWDKQYLSLESIKNIAKYCDSDTLFVKYGNEVESIFDQIINLEYSYNLKTAFDIFCIKTETKNIKTDLETLKKQVYKKYPLVFQLKDNNNINKLYSQIGIYVNAIG